ncbi:MAG: hypothetical protein Q4C84_10725 [Bacillota bacterium]|nr:hypothetical protein [Bacillota bacterium]
MKKNMIAVCDSDTDYACNFTEYLNNKKKLPFRAEAFTDVEKFYNLVGRQSPPMLLIAQKDVDERIQQIKEENVVVLSDEKEEQKPPYKCIYKYQSAESVIKEVMEYYTEKNQVSFYSDAGKGMKIVGIYSPSEICGNCLFALTAAQILGEEKRVLYISMEDFSGLEQLFLQEYEKNLTDFFFSLRCGKENLWEELEGMIQQQGDMDYLPPVESPEDIKSIPFAHWNRLFEIIKNSGRYHLLILNISSAVDELFSVLNLCREIYMPAKTGFIADCKMSQFQTLMKSWGVIEEDRIKQVSLPKDSEEGMEGIHTVQELKIGPWGKFVRKALESHERRKQ